MQRVQKLLSNYGYCSRRKAEELISQGKVKVNDKTISIGDKATSEDKIYVDGKLVQAEKKVYLMLNKPIGCVTALSDTHEKTIMEYIDIDERVYPVGRLDKQTSGIILLTNDGDFANSITHPSNEVKKTYIIETKKKISDNAIKRLEKGINLEDGKTRPAKVNRLKENIIELVIHEGKNRIVRRMMEKLGYRIRSLKRTKIGKYTLGNLKQGQYKKIQQII